MQKGARRQFVKVGAFSSFHTVSEEAGDTEFRRQVDAKIMETEFSPATCTQEKVTN